MIRFHSFSAIALLRAAAATHVATRVACTRAIRLVHSSRAASTSSAATLAKIDQQRQEEHDNPSSSRSSHSHRFAALLAGGLAAAVGFGSLAQVSSAAAAPSARAAPPWLGDRLCESAAAGDTARLASLLSTYHPIDGINTVHRFGWTPLHAAVAGGHLGTVKWILARPECEVNVADRYTPRARNLDSMVVKHSARQDAFPELYPSVPGNGMTALHYAALCGSSLDIVDALIAAGADLNKEDAAGLTADRLLDFSNIPDEDPNGTSGVDPQLAAKKKHHAAVVARIKEARAAAEARRVQQEKEDRIRFPLELKLKKEMIGQEVPILSVAAAIRRRENGWFDATKPLVFLFLGSSGVGKTMLAKLLAQHVVKDEEDGFIRIDMSEYQSKHEMSRFIGSPPGYVGHETGGQLTEKLAKCPKAVVLLDEVEKAHPDILTLLLAVFDEGRLTDGKGKTIHCPEAIFVMTSNVVQEEIRDAIDSGYELRPKQSILEDLHRTMEQMRTLGGFTTTPLPPPSPSAETVETSAPAVKEDEATTTTILPGAMPVTPIDHQSQGSMAPAVPSSAESLSRELSKLASDTDRFLRFIVHPILKRAFKLDEFIGRINDIILFHPFSKQDLEQTVSMELNRWASRAKQRHNIDLHWSPALVESLTLNFDEKWGYRSVIYAVEKRVVNVLASAHERDLISSGCRVLLDLAEHPTQPGQPPIVIREVTRPSANATHAEGRKKFLGIF